MNNNNFKIKKNYLLKDDQQLIKVSSTIKKNIIIDDKIILLLDFKGLKNDRNISCFDFKGNLLWNIEEILKLHKENYFTNIYLNQKNELMAYNINGIEVKIDLSNGEFIEKELIR